MDHIFDLQNWLKHVQKKNQFITPGAFVGILPHIWNKNQTILRQLRGLPIETDFRKLVKHIHSLEGFKTLTNMILGTFRGMTCI